MKKQYKPHENKNERKNLILIIIVIILLLISLVLLYILISERFKKTVYSDKTVSENQSDIALDIDRKDDSDAYTELMGFGTLTINKSNPEVYLINPESNKVNLSFDVFYEDELLYSSGLIQPGKMETFDIYSRLDAGRHTLLYSISSYEQESNAVLWSGVQQKQDIQIIK